MDNIRIIDVKQGVLADNDRDAAALRSRLKAEKTFLLNLMSSTAPVILSGVKRSRRIFAPNHR